MEQLAHFLTVYSSFLPLILFCISWDIVWRLIGLWKAGRNNEIIWFLGIAIFNTLGILPIIYIILRSKK